jgi:hypothetical protein
MRLWRRAALTCAISLPAAWLGGCGVLSGLDSLSIRSCSESEGCDSGANPDVTVVEDAGDAGDGATDAPGDTTTGAVDASTDSRGDTTADGGDAPTDSSGNPGDDAETGVPERDSSSADAQPDADAAPDVVPDAAPDVASDAAPDAAPSPCVPDATPAGGGLPDGGSLGAGLVAFYPFDECSGTTAVDASGNGHTALMVGAVFAPGIRGNAATMHGSGGEYVDLPAGIVSGLDAFSIATWVYLNTSPNWNFVFHFGSGTTTYMFLSPNSSSGTLRYGITTGGSGQEQLVDAPALTTGSWHQVAVTQAVTGKNATVTLYVDGALVVNTQGITLTPSALGTTSQDWIGRSEFPNDPYMNGQVDNFRIYSRALSASEVQLLFDQQL